MQVGEGKEKTYIMLLCLGVKIQSNQVMVPISTSFNYF